MQLNFLLLVFVILINVNSERLIKLLFNHTSEHNNYNRKYLTDIMLGAWPCGIIVLLGELFGAESNSQVYALLHTFLLKNDSSTK